MVRSEIYRGTIYLSASHSLPRSVMRQTVDKARGTSRQRGKLGDFTGDHGVLALIAMTTAGLDDRKGSNLTTSRRLA